MIFNISSGSVRKLPILDSSYPKDVSVTNVGTSATFTVVISEDGKPAEYTYQWYYDDTAVGGATSSSYTRAAEVGTHTIYCVVTNKVGSITSRIATFAATTLYLYKSGDERTSVTGGWKGTGVAFDSSIYTVKATPKITKGTSSMTIEANQSKDHSSGICHTTNKISLSGYSKLYFDGAFTDTGNNKSHVYVGIWSAIGSTQSSNRVAYVQGLSDKTFTIDVSSLTGSYYIGIFVFRDISVATVGSGKAVMRNLYLK